MESQKLRELFFNFFREKGHKILPSAPMIIKNDPTLMFTNAGMNQFKDIFLGNNKPQIKRVANSQKCLRVSGKHNDLEEVGHDTYHHTMFEMMGNWSFGDYFKQEAIRWAWEFLTETLKIDKERLYVTVFEGNKSESLEQDQESLDIWLQNDINTNHILKGSKKDNFWEMGETGPCGPCSEIHVDIRDDHERNKIPGNELVNKGNPQVIEIWNLVFIQYNRKADGTLENLPDTHVDTGMGLERLCMVMQNKKSNYDTDIFQNLIHKISSITGKQYGVNEKWDIALRVVADHLRAVSFSIADGQIPSNTKAGYVIRRILRRAVRYGYNYLEIEEPFMYSVVPILVETMGDQYPELKKGAVQISKIIHEEETAFLRTLGKGLKKIEQITEEIKKSGNNTFPGDVAFEMYDTFGFPVDLSTLILKEKNINLDLKGFEEEMKKQKNRSKNVATVETSDWKIIHNNNNTLFTGYEKTEDDVRIVKYRVVKQKDKEIFQIVLDKTPFYAESGGQVGDTGYLVSNSEKINIIDTIKENDLTIHLANSVPSKPEEVYKAVIDKEKRLMTAVNHTATHLLHFALRKVLGDHVEQKGSLVTPEKLRFDFSHTSKLSSEELLKIENLANSMVREDHLKKANDNIPLEKAKSMGAIALFGEKYGDKVRIVEFGKSIELCGGTHTESTGNIGIIKIISESAIASGIRRIEAVTASVAEQYINDKINIIDEIASMLKTSGNIKESIEKLIEENSSLKKAIEKQMAETANNKVQDMLSKSVMINDIRFVSGKLESVSADVMKNIAFKIRSNSDDIVMVIGSETNEKANMLVMVSDNLVKNKNIDAVLLIREIAKEINGGGGGQPFLATAGGKNPAGILKAIAMAEDIVKKY